MQILEPESASCHWKHVQTLEPEFAPNAQELEEHFEER